MFLPEEKIVLIFLKRQAGRSESAVDVTPEVKVEVIRGRDPELWNASSLWKRKRQEDAFPPRSSQPPHPTPGEVTRENTTLTTP